MSRKRSPYRLAPCDAAGTASIILGRFCLSGDIIFCKRGLKVFKLQLKLVDELLVPL